MFLLALLFCLYGKTKVHSCSIFKVFTALHVLLYMEHSHCFVFLLFLAELSFPNI